MKRDHDLYEFFLPVEGIVEYDWNLCRATKWPTEVTSKLPSCLVVFRSAAMSNTSSNIQNL